jgi:hypothetical protein
MHGVQITKVQKKIEHEHGFQNKKQLKSTRSTSHNICEREIMVVDKKQ